MKKSIKTTWTVSSCGECQYCHPTKDKAIACFVEPPKYLYGDEDAAIFLQYVETDVTRPACNRFEPRKVQ